jgi:hypothetical protein
MTAQDDEVWLKRQLLLRELPPKKCTYRSAGTASGHLCALCELPIVRPDVEFTVEWDEAGEHRRCVFHLVCYHLWSES